jgi:hypothetical protein
LEALEVGERKECPEHSRIKFMWEDIVPGEIGKSLGQLP